MAEFPFSTPYIVEGCDVPLRGAPFAPRQKKRKNEPMNLVNEKTITVRRCGHVLQMTNQSEKIPPFLRQKLHHAFAPGKPHQGGSSQIKVGASFAESNGLHFAAFAAFA